MDRSGEQISHAAPASAPAAQTAIVPRNPSTPASDPPISAPTGIIPQLSMFIVADTRPRRSSAHSC